MRKTAALLLLLGLLSCTRYDILQMSDEKESKMFFAEFSTDADVKTYVDESLSMYWVADDRISVFCSPTNEQYRFTGVTGQDSGCFENLTAPVTPVFSSNYAVYPYDSDNACGGESSVSVTLPAVQQYAPSSFGVRANTMVAVSESIEDNVFKFKNACGFLMLKLYGGDRVKSIKLYGNNGEKIAGPATITASCEYAPAVAMSGDASISITLDCSEAGVGTSSSIDNFTPFWMVVPPITFTKGFTIEITNTDDDKIVRSTSKSVTIERNRIAKMAPVKIDAQNSNDLLSFSLSDGEHSYEAFDISNGYVNVQVPNGTDMTNMVASFNHNGASVKVNDVEQTSEADAHDFSDFVNPVTYVVTSKAGISQSYVIRMFDLPIVFATTPNAVPITSKTVWTENCTFKIRDTDGTLIDFGGTNLKGRGNSSWLQDKKPYAVKFDKKKEVLGMPSHKRWCLLSNCYGYVFGNQLGFEMARRCDGIAWSPKVKYVELFLNGDYKGLYLIAEQIKIDKNRLNITEMSSSDIEGEAITGGYLLTFDNTWDEVNKFHSQYFNMPIMFKDPDEDVLVQAQFDYLQNYINNFEASLKDEDRFEAREYLQYIDIDSFIDVWLVWEMAGPWGNTSIGTDFIAPRSVYYYKDRNDVLKAGPVWDFDSYYFCRKKIVTNNCQYYGKLFKDSYFVAKVKERWPLFKQKMHGDNDNVGMESYLDSLYSTVILSARRDRVINPWINFTTFHPDDQYNYIKSNGIYSKLDYLESYINSLVVNYDTKPGGNEDVDNQQDESENFDFNF